MGKCCSHSWLTNWCNRSPQKRNYFFHLLFYYYLELNYSLTWVKSIALLQNSYQKAICLSYKEVEPCFFQIYQKKVWRIFFLYYYFLSLFQRYSFLFTALLVIFYDEEYLTCYDCTFINSFQKNKILIFGYLRP